MTALIDKSAFSADLLPEFKNTELLAMHHYCLKYRYLVRAGGTPTDGQSDKFMAFHKVCYGEGVALA